MKKILLSCFLYCVTYTPLLAAAPGVVCNGLPGCSESIGGTDNAGLSSGRIIEVVAFIVATLIKYTAVLAVLALMISGIMYLISGGEEEKVNKAKTWIMWSLVGVIVSISAWMIINLINNFSITL